MARFLVYATRAGAENRSRAEAQRRGCGTPDHVTQFWWEVEEGVAGDWAVVVPNAEADERLTPTDRSRLSLAFAMKRKANRGR